MHALSDEQRIERLEARVDLLGREVDTKVDRLGAKVGKGFSETRAHFRMLLGVQLATIVAMILGFAGLILQHL